MRTLTLDPGVTGLALYYGRNVLLVTVNPQTAIWQLPIETKPVADLLRVFTGANCVDVAISEAKRLKVIP